MPTIVDALISELAPGTRAFVDTNVFVYSVDNDEPKKRAAAHDLLGALGEARTVISAQVLNEFYVTVTRKLARPLDTDSARQAVTNLSLLDVVPLDATLVLRGVARSRASQLSLWDGLIVEAARLARCAVLLTEDLHDGADFGGLRIVNPFDGL